MPLIPVKICVKCGYVGSLSDFTKNASYKDGHNSACATCTRSANKVWYKANLVKCRKYATNWCHRNPIQTMLNAARQRARRKQLEFSLVIEDIQIPEYCPLLGLKLVQSRGGFGPASPSLDRIDSSKGYTPDNIQIICWKANRLKNDATLTELKQLTTALEARQVQAAYGN